MWTWTNMTVTSVHVVRRPIRIRCVELCLHDATCQAVSYRTRPGHAEKCALYDHQLAEDTFIHSSEWNLIVLF